MPARRPESPKSQNSTPLVLERDITILQTLATSQALASEDWRTFYDQAKAGLQGRAYLILVGADGRQLVNTYVPYDEQPAVTGDPETLRRIARARAPVVSNLFTSLAVKKPVFNVSIPILRDGQLRFVMSLGLLPDDLVSLLRSQKLGPEWVTMIWDADGTILARSRDNARYLGTEIPQRMREHGRQALVRTTNPDGTDVLLATAHSQISGWGVGVNVPYSLISEQIRRALLRWGAAAFLAITFALAFGLRFARQITSSLSIASKAAAFGRDDQFTITSSRLKEADAFLATLKIARHDLADRADALKRALEQFRVAVEATPNGMIVVTGEGQIVLVNLQTEKLFGYARHELVGQNIEMLIPERFRDRHAEDLENYMRHPAMRAMGAGRDLGGRRKDGSEFPVEIGLSPINQDGRGGVLATVIDISERVRAQEHQKLLMRELQHRTKNLFAVMQAIINRSFVEGRTVAQAKQAIGGRLRALARTHAILAGAAWEGAPLGEILKREFGDDLSKNVDIGACDIVVNAGAAHQFALIIQELATNALKYGALSVPSGRISIVGNVEQANGASQFSLQWCESGGPLVVKPSRKGFGSVILFDAAQEFGMDIDVKHDPKGLHYALRVPMEKIMPSKPLESIVAGDIAV